MIVALGTPRRRPDGDVTEAVAGTTFGDKVICVEWFGDDSMPAPKWHRDLRPTFDEVEEDYVTGNICLFDLRGWS
jgi:hypothetical protein